MQVEIRAAPAVVLPSPAIPIEIVNRRWIGVLIVKSPHGLTGAVVVHAVMSAPIVHLGSYNFCRVPRAARARGTRQTGSG